MLDISQATNMLTSLGVTSTLAARTAERTLAKHSGADPQTFLKELHTTLAELSKDASQPSGTGAADAKASATSTAFQSTASLHNKSSSGTSAATATAAATGTANAGSKEAAVKAPFSNLEEFRQWERKLGDTFAADYEPPDYVRVISQQLSGGNDTIVNRFLFFKEHPEFAVDYQNIRSGKLSQFPTDGSTLVKSDLSEMSVETAAFYKANPDQLRMAEGFNMDPTLVKMRMTGGLEIPADANSSSWLMDHKWTKDGVVAQDNRIAYANADFIGLDGKGAGTYRLGRYDPTTGNIVNPDGTAYDPLTGEAVA